MIEGGKVASVSLAEPFAGWAKREKTDDSRNQAVPLERVWSRTSRFAPVRDQGSWGSCFALWARIRLQFTLVGVKGLEPSTSRSRTVRSTN